MSRVVKGRSFKITKNQARGYGYAKARSMKANPGVTTIAAINGRGAYSANRSARSVMSKLKQNDRKPAARRRLTEAQREAFKNRMEMARNAKRSGSQGVTPRKRTYGSSKYLRSVHGKSLDRLGSLPRTPGLRKNRSTSASQSATSRKNIKKAQAARRAWGSKLPKGKRVRVGVPQYGTKAKAHKLKSGVYIANGVRFMPRSQRTVAAERAKPEEARESTSGGKSRAQKRTKKAGTKNMARRRKRASGLTKKRRSSKRRRKATTTKKTKRTTKRRLKARKGAARRKTAARKTVRRRKSAAAPKRRRRSRKAAAAPKRRRKARRSTGKKRRSSGKRRRSSGRRRKTAKRAKKFIGRRRGKARGRRHATALAMSRRKKHGRKKSLKANRRRHRRNGSKFKMNGVGDVLKLGATLFAGFALHRVLTNLFDQQVLSRLLPAPAPAATSGFGLQENKGILASLAVGAGGSFLASKVIKNAETKKLIIGGMIASTLHGVIVSVLKSVAPAGADMLAGPEDGTAARLSAMYGMRGLGAGASIMPRYGVINGLGEYFREPMNGLGEYFREPMNGLGEYIDATNGLGTYEQNADLYQAAAGFGSHDYNGNHIDPSGNLDRQLDIAEAAAGVGALAPFEAAAGIGPMQAAAGFGAINTTPSADTWIPGSADPQLWAGVKAITNGQSASEMVPAGTLQTDGGQGIFG